MIDYFSLALSHCLMLLAAWRLVFRSDIDDDNAVVVSDNTDILGQPRAGDTRESGSRA